MQPDQIALPADTHSKALSVNLDGTIYGSLAEIGAGQEVARWFLKVGGASGSVAQTISAYDKTVSDDIYGAGTRYVSRERLTAMLDHEYRQILDRLGSIRGATTKFYAFADTASARNYAGDNEQHAWLGLRFQAEPRGEPNDVILHVELTDRTNERQQEALGILGVNLIHAVHHRRGSIDEFLSALWSGLSLDRMEIDVVEFAGPALAHLDASRCGLAALRRGMGVAIVFDSAGNLVEPSSVLRKRPLLVNRGRFAPFSPVHAEMLAAAERRLRGEGIPLGREPVQALELSLNPVGGGGPATDDEALERIAPCRTIGPVIVSTFGEGYLLGKYLRRYTAEPVRFVVGVTLLARLLNEKFYGELPGGLLESLGRFLDVNARMYVYPMSREAVLASLESAAELYDIEASASGDVTADGLRPRPPMNHLYRYFREGGWIVPIEADS